MICSVLNAFSILMLIGSVEANLILSPTVFLQGIGGTSYCDFPQDPICCFNQDIDLIDLPLLLLTLSIRSKTSSSPDVFNHLFKNDKMVVIATSFAEEFHNLIFFLFSIKYFISLFIILTHNLAG